MYIEDHYLSSPLEENKSIYLKTNLFISSCVIHWILLILKIEYRKKQNVKQDVVKIYVKYVLCWWYILCCVLCKKMEKRTTKVSTEMGDLLGLQRILISVDKYGYSLKIQQILIFIVAFGFSNFFSLIIIFFLDLFITYI